jgi:CubicO group peptidase (beta-lactamase class C family)
VESGRQKGSQLVITRGGRIAHHSLRGERDAEAGLPVEPDTVWRIYSMTEPITSVTQVLFSGDDCWMGMRPLVYQALIDT